MVTRTGDASQSARMNSYVQQTQGRMRETQLSVATGKAVRTFAEIPQDASNLLQTRQQLVAAETFLKQGDQMVDRLQSMDGALSNILDLSDRLRTLFVQRLDGTLGSEVPLASELENSLQQISSSVNLRVDGRYAFAGSETSTRPIQIPDDVSTAADLADIYKGDDYRMTLRADLDVEITYGITGDQFQPIFDLLGAAMEAQESGDLDGIRTAMDGLTTAFENVVDMRAKLGSTINRIEGISDSHAASINYMQEIVSNIEDVDITAAMTKISQDQVAIEASYITISRISGLSLADYIR